MYYFALLLFFISIILSPIKFKRIFNIGTKIRLTLSFFLFLLIFFTYKIPINEFNNRVEELSANLKNDNPSMLFSTKDKIGILGLNLIMGSCGYFFYPEVAKENLMMIFPAPPNNVRVYNSDFAIKSIKVRKILSIFINKLQIKKNNIIQMSEKKLVWHPKDYIFGSKEARYALALNSAIINAKAYKEKLSWIINVTIKVKCEYPKNSLITLIPEPKLEIEEGLFWVLQETGFLNPYIAEWTFKINSKDFM